MSDTEEYEGEFPGQIDVKSGVPAPWVAGPGTGVLYAKHPQFFFEDANLFLKESCLISLSLFFLYHIIGSSTDVRSWKSTTAD